jgi:magnesium transporter
MNAEKKESKPTWIDLLDPNEHTILEALSPLELHHSALVALSRRPEKNDQVRPKLESHGEYVLGILLVPVAVPAEDRVFYQEVDLVLTESQAFTVRKTPVDGTPFDVSGLQDGRHLQPSPGFLAYRVIDEVAESFLDLADAINEEIDGLEDQVEEMDNEDVRGRLTGLRHDLLHIRRTLGPTRDAIRSVIDDRVELDTGDLFPREVELHFGDAFDKVLRALEGLELARDLIAGVRDLHMSKVANDQNDVMKRLTAIASILLLPTLIVGLYGQNFVSMPELKWRYGYPFSWALIILTSIGQLWYFRKKGWI